MANNKNGVTNVDNQQMEEMRATVVHQELSARSFRAMRQKMEDTIAISELQEKYDAVVAENQERMRIAQEEYQKQLAAHQKAIQEAADKADAESNVKTKLEAV